MKINLVFIYFLLIASSILFTPVKIYASSGDLGMSGLKGAVTANTSSYASNTDLGTSIGNIISAILALSGTIFFVLIVYGGTLWMTAAGSSEKIDKAKQIVIAAAIGGAITASAYSVTFFVMSKIGGNPNGSEGKMCCMSPGGSYEAVTYDLSKNGEYASCENIDESYVSVDMSKCEK